MRARGEGAGEGGGDGGDVRAQARLRDALHWGGGPLREYHDRGDFWLVEWTTRDGARHTSAIRKNDLTVLSAGICLHNEREFDLQSLVGVVERSQCGRRVRVNGSMNSRL